MEGKQRRDKDLMKGFSAEVVEDSRRQVEDQEQQVLKEMEWEKRRRRICDFPDDDIVGGRISYEDE